MRMIVLYSLCLLLLPSAAVAQNFGPKNYAECVMLNVKKASSRDAAMLMRRACKCRFQPVPDECRDYTREAADCMIANLAPVEQDAQAWGVERACRTRYPAGK